MKQKNVKAPIALLLLAATLPSACGWKSAPPANAQSQTDAAKEQEGLEAGVLQALRHADRVVRHQRRIDAMFLWAENDRLGRVGRFFRLAEDAPYELFNH